MPSVRDVCMQLAREAEAVKRAEFETREAEEKRKKEEHQAEAKAFLVSYLGEELAAEFEPSPETDSLWAFSGGIAFSGARKYDGKFHFTRMGDFNPDMEYVQNKPADSIKAMIGRWLIAREEGASQEITKTISRADDAEELERATNSLLEKFPERVEEILRIGRARRAVFEARAELAQAKEAEQAAARQAETERVDEERLAKIERTVCPLLTIANGGEGFAWCEAARCAWFDVDSVHCAVVNLGGPR